MAKHGKTQARRHHGNRTGLPGWAWLVLGIVLTLGVVLLAPRYLGSGAGDGFLRPRPNPDAQPSASAGQADDTPIVADGGPARTGDAADAAAPPRPTQYDFYTLLPGEEVAMSDAELAATARAEAARQASAPTPPAASAEADAVAPATLPAPAPAQTAAAVAGTIRPGNDTPYVLQAGAFGASGDAEAVKAKIALLGLSARVEAAQINGKTVYRVRMGPYASAGALAEAKRKLGSGGLPALAIKAK